jgi:branched-chain amino acid transport system ATP-binding protein
MSQPTAREVLLDVDHVTLRFGGVVALNDVSFSLYKGEILGLIGPNGAGKTTCFNVMTGVYKPTSGAVTFDDEQITGRKPHQINRMGVARTFQNIRLFPEMTALENVMVGTDSRHHTSVVGALFRLYRKRVKPEELPQVNSSNGLVRAVQQVRRTSAQIFGLSRHTLEERAGERKSLELLRFVGIEHRANDLARNLPYGDQRRLAS